MWERDLDILPFPIIVKMAQIGTLGEYDSVAETWASYIERFELYVDCNGIEDSKKVSTFLTVVGVKTYSLLRDLCTPDKPSTKSFAVLVELVQKHLFPTPSFIAERYRFSKRVQLEGESIAEYVANLKKMTTYCDFGAALNDYLRDRLVSGIRSENAKQRLLSEAALTFEQAIKIVLSMEQAEKSAATLSIGRPERIQQMTAGTAARLRPGGGNVGQQHSQTARCGNAAWTTAAGGVKDNSTRPSPAGSRHGDSGSARGQCLCCGQTGHYRSQCRLLGVKCHYCGKVNHIAKVCRAKLAGKPGHSDNTYVNKNKHNYKNNRKHNYLEGVAGNATGDVVSDDTEHYVEDVANLFKMNEATRPVDRIRVDPIKLNLVVEGKTVVFEADTGASVSVCSEDFYNCHFQKCKLEPSELVLSSYTNQPIVPLGKIKVNVLYGNVNREMDLYIIKAGSHPLVGRDWLRSLGVEISFKNHDTLLEISKTNVNNCVDLANKLFKEFPNVFSDELGCFKDEPVKLALKENTVPRYFKPRPIPFSLKTKVESELARLVDEKVLLPVSSSDWGTPIVPVLKKCGSVRICGDFKVTLNPCLEVEKFPLPRIDELFANLQKGDKFSKIDLCQAYTQLELDQESQKLCTISTHKGLFCYSRVPFGITSASAIFQKKIEQTLQGIDQIAVFLDDILITAENDKAHYEKLREVCRRLDEKGLTVKKSKCTLFANQVEYLGFVIDKHGLHTDPKKVEAIKNAPMPKTVTEVKALIGLINYYSKFLPNLSSILSPLYNLLRKDVKFDFNNQCIQAFNRVKELLSNETVLAHYDGRLPLKLAVDASSLGLGAVLSVVTPEGFEKPIAYQSRTLTSAEVNYSQIDREALAIVWGVKKFNQYLYGREFTLCTDHKPLLSIFGEKKGLSVFSASRLQRYSLFLSGYKFNIQYVKSADHGNADAFSRLPLSMKEPVVSEDEDWKGSYLHCLLESSVPLTFETVQTETQKDPLLCKVFGYVKYGWPNHIPEQDNGLLPFFTRKDELSIVNNILVWGYKVVVPSKMRKYVLDELHSSHLGIVKMKSVARNYVWWPGIDDQIVAVANNCASCLMERNNPSKCQLHTWHYPSAPWERLHMDYLGPINGKMYFLIIDAYSKWLEVFPVSSTSANLAISHLRDLFSRFGIPLAVHSDNGSPFSSFEFRNFMLNNGIRHTFSPPYHPMSNGLSENSVKYAKNKIKCALHDKKDISVALSRILFDYRNAVHSTTNETPSKLMFNRQLRTRLDLLRPNLTMTVNKKQDKQREHFSGSKTRTVYPGQHVIVRDYRTRDKWISATVQKQISNVIYEVLLASGVVFRRHIDQIIAVQGQSTADVVEAGQETPSVPYVETAQVGREPITASPRARPSPRGVGSPSPASRRSLRTSVSCDLTSPNGPVTSPNQLFADHNNDRRYPLRVRKPVQRLDL